MIQNLSHGNINLLYLDKKLGFMGQIKDMEDVIIAGSGSKIFTRFGSEEKKESEIRDLRGMIDKDVSSTELEDKANEWRSKLSD